MLGKLNLQKLLVPLTNMGLRGVGLVGRFALSFYLVKFLSLTETGQFGLIVGVAGVLPALFGFGMNYFLSREIIGVDIEDAFARIRDKMVVMVTLLGVTLLGALGINAVHPIDILGNLWLAGLIIVLEVIAFDLHIVLISLRKPLLANFLLIVRSAAWVFPFIAMSFFWPQYRNLDTLLVFWLGSLVLSFTVLWLFTRNWPWLGTLSRRIDKGWIGNTIKAAGLVYLSDLGLVIYSYFDRFFIAGHLGLAATGVYTFYWTMANALLVLITAAVVQVSLPGLVDGFKAGETAWRQRFGKMLVKALAGSFAMAIVMYGAVTFLLPYIGNPELARHPLIFPLMLVAIVVKIVADMTHYGLYSRKKDRTLALVNISGIVVNLGLTIALVSLLGLIGVALSMLGTAAYLLASRGWFLYRDVAHPHPRGHCRGADMSTSGSRAKLRADAEWYFRSWKKPKPGFGTWLRLILLTPGYQLVMSIRLQEKLGRIPKLGVVLRRILWYMTTQYFNSDIDPQAQFGPGLYLPHPICVVIGAEVRAGRDVVILQGTTLGRRGEPDGHLVIGDDVQIGSGAKVLGVITIGKGARIGANAVVLKSVPENAIAVGIPARVVSRAQSASPVPTLDTL